MQQVASADAEAVFVMVDLQEDEGQVVDFFDRYELRDLYPVIDPNGETSRRYALAALPQTFFIGPDGVIRHIEIGGPIDVDAIRRGISKARGG